MEEPVSRMKEYFNGKSVTVCNSIRQLVSYVTIFLLSPSVHSLMSIGLSIFG